MTAISKEGFAQINVNQGCSWAWPTQLSMAQRPTQPALTPSNSVDHSATNQPTSNASLSNFTGAFSKRFTGFTVSPFKQSKVHLKVQGADRCQVHYKSLQFIVQVQLKCYLDWHFVFESVVLQKAWISSSKKTLFCPNIYHKLWASFKCIPCSFDEHFCRNVERCYLKWAKVMRCNKQRKHSH